MLLTETIWLWWSTRWDNEGAEIKESPETFEILLFAMSNMNRLSSPLRLDTLTNSLCDKFSVWSLVLCNQVESWPIRQTTIYNLIKLFKTKMCTIGLFCNILLHVIWKFWNIKIKLRFLGDLQFHSKFSHLFDYPELSSVY